MTYYHDELESHVYTYLTTDLRNNKILAELPLRSVSYENKLSAFGEATGSISVNRETLALDIQGSTAEGKTGLYILRDGVPMWGGIIAKSKYDSESRKVNVVANTFEWYFHKRLQLKTKYWSGSDQLDIARWLVTNDNAASDVLINVSNATSPRIRERTMFGYEFHTVGSELDQLSNLIDGFDYNVLIQLDSNGDLARNLMFFYPAAGQSRQTTNLFFEFPGSIQNFVVNKDADTGGNVFWAIGAGEGTEQVVAQATDFSTISQGWPRLEVSRSYKSVVRPSTLQEHANADRDRLSAPVTIFEVSVRPDQEPTLGSYSPGDWARFRLSDDYMTPPLDAYARITAVKVDVEDESGLETVSLTLGSDNDNSNSEQ